MAIAYQVGEDRGERFPRAVPMAPDSMRLQAIPGTPTVIHQDSPHQYCVVQTV